MRNIIRLIAFLTVMLHAISVAAQSKPAVAQYANTSLSNLTSPTAINTNLLPATNVKKNLGSLAKAWNNLYLDSGLYLGGYRFFSLAGNISKNNTATGLFTLDSNTSGSANTANGYGALSVNNTGYANTAIGNQALSNNTTGSQNTAIGSDALFSNAKGNNNTAEGSGAMNSNTSGSSNTANGLAALYFNTQGSDNVAVGNNALATNYNGSDNVAVGSFALKGDGTIDASGDVAVGYKALYNISTNSTAVGAEAGLNATGSANSCFGYHAGNTITSGSSNTIIGFGADVTSGSYSNATALGNFAQAGGSNHVRIGNSSVTLIGGQVSWSTLSDSRIKNNIQQNVPGLQFINLLKPVTYHYDVTKQENISGKKTENWNGKFDIEKTQFTGFLAQDVEAAAKKINYDFSGVDVPKDDKYLYSLRYSDFVVPLVKAVQELSAQNDSLKNKNENLEERLSRLEALMIVSNQSIVNGQQSTSISSASLSQNIPNPFSNSTTISYSISQKFSSAIIIITDKNGNALKQINVTNNKGSISVDAATLTSGAYQYSLYADGKMLASKQFIISK